MSISWNKAGHSTRFNAAQLIHKNSLHKLNWLRNKWLSPLVFRRVMLRDKRKWFVKTRDLFLHRLALSAWQPFLFHVHKCSYSMAPFGDWLSAGQIMIKVGHAHTVTASVCTLLSAIHRGRRRSEKTPVGPFSLKRVEWWLTSQDTVKFPHLIPNGCIAGAGNIADTLCWYWIMTFLMWRTEIKDTVITFRANLELEGI